LSEYALSHIIRAINSNSSIGLPSMRVMVSMNPPAVMVVVSDIRGVVVMVNVMYEAVVIFRS